MNRKRSISKKDISDNTLNNKSLRQLVDSEDSDAMLKIQWENTMDQNQESSREINTERIWLKIQTVISRRRSGKSKRDYSIKGLLRIAAVIALLIAGYIAGQKMELSVSRQDKAVLFSNPRSVRSEILLPDNTLVTLGPSSSLEYTVGFGRSHRILELEGRAYFRVAANPGLPFRVESGDIIIEALGTEFNVLNLQGRIRTSLVEGKLKLSSASNPGSVVYLSENETVSLQDGEFTGPTQLRYCEISWKNGQLEFEAATLGQICKELEHWFDVDIEVSEEIRGKYSFQLTVGDEGIEEILDVLSLAAPISYSSKKAYKYKIFEKN